MQQQMLAAIMLWGRLVFMACTLPLFELAVKPNCCEMGCVLRMRSDGDARYRSVARLADRPKILRPLTHLIPGRGLSASGNCLNHMQPSIK
jgi:hypothetical protein